MVGREKRAFAWESMLVLESRPWRWIWRGSVVVLGSVVRAAALAGSFRALRRARETRPVPQPRSVIWRGGGGESDGGVWLLGCRVEKSRGRRIVWRA